MLTTNKAVPDKQRTLHVLGDGAFKHNTAGHSATPSGNLLFDELTRGVVKSFESMNSAHRSYAEQNIAMKWYLHFV